MRFAMTASYHLTPCGTIENRSLVTFSRIAEASRAYAPPVLVFVRFFLAILRMGTASFSLLRMLADGRFHSGERLRTALGLSRGGILNLIRRIEALGLRVVKVPGRGYRLAEALDLFELDGLAAGLKKKSTRLNSSHITISYAVFCLKKKRDRCAYVRARALPSRARPHS